jgi:signal transduction histidine kinase
MVERAVALVRVAGFENASRAFIDPNGGFLSGNLYVFVIDFRGTILVNGALPRAIGGNALGARDSEGRFYVQEMIRTARDHGEGWVHYEFFNPCTGRPSPKSSFVKRVDEILVGVGFYGAVVT